MREQRLRGPIRVRRPHWGLGWRRWCLRVAGSPVPHAAAALAHLSGPVPGLLHRRASARREATEGLGDRGRAAAPMSELASDL